MQHSVRKGLRLGLTNWSKAYYRSIQSNIQTHNVTYGYNRKSSKKVFNASTVDKKVFKLKEDGKIKKETTIPKDSENKNYEISNDEIEGINKLNLYKMGLTKNGIKYDRMNDKQCNNTESTVIIGSGVMGLNTAYFLARQGVKNIHIYDSGSHAATGASEYNGGFCGLPYGMLTYPGTILSALKNFVSTPKKDYPYFTFKWSMLLQRPFVLFLRLFLRASIMERKLVKRRGIVKNQLGLLGERYRNEIMENEKFTDEQIGVKRGSLTIFRNKKSFQEAINEAEENNMDVVICDYEKALEFEPCIKNFKEEVFGAIYYKNEVIADCRKFCHMLTQVLQERYGVQFHFNTQITEIVKSKQGESSIEFLRTAEGKRILGKQFIIAAGANSAQLVSRMLQYMIPMVSMKGYTIITPFKSEEIHPRHSVVFEDMKMAAVNYGNVLRHVGVAEFDNSQSHQTKTLDRFKNACFSRFEEYIPREIRQKQLKSSHQLMNLDIFGEKELKEKEEQEPEFKYNPIQGAYPPDNGKLISPASRIWVGRRPIVGDDICVIGGTSRVKNLYLNTGHAGAGWCLSFASGKLLSDFIVKGSTNLPIKDLDLIKPDRFAKEPFGIPDDQLKTKKN